jgi:hypothetical protein
MHTSVILYVCAFVGTITVYICLYLYLLKAE